MSSFFTSSLMASYLSGLKALLFWTTGLCFEFTYSQWHITTDSILGMSLYDHAKISLHSWMNCSNPARISGRSFNPSSINLSGYSWSRWKGTRSSTGYAQISSSDTRGSRSLNSLISPLGVLISLILKIVVTTAGWFTLWQKLFTPFT